MSIEFFNKWTDLRKEEEKLPILSLKYFMSLKTLPNLSVSNNVKNTNSISSYQNELNILFTKNMSRIEAIERELKDLASEYLKIHDQVIKMIEESVDPIEYYPDSSLLGSLFYIQNKFSRNQDNYV